MHGEVNHTSRCEATHVEHSRSSSHARRSQPYFSLRSYPRGAFAELESRAGITYDRYHEAVRAAGGETFNALTLMKYIVTYLTCFVVPGRVRI